MKKNFNFMEVDCYSETYPKEILDLAKRSGEPVTDIAKSKDIKPIPQSTKIFFRRDIVEGILMVSETEDGLSFIEFEDGECHLSSTPIKKLISRIDDFLQMDPVYTPGHESKQKFIHVMTKEELDEMGPDPYLEEED